MLLRGSPTLLDNMMTSSRYNITALRRLDDSVMPMDRWSDAGPLRKPNGILWNR